jgi:hypothetical protein
LKAAAVSNQILDIVARPSLLYIVAALWQELRPLLAAGRLTSAQVIDRFISHSYQRQAEKERSLVFAVLTTSERRYFHEGLAVFMASRGTTNQISGPDMDTAVERLYRSYPDDSHILDNVFMEGAHPPLKKRLSDPETAIETIATDVRTHGILVNDLARRGTFRFAHKSFYELLFAKSYAYDLLGIEPMFYGAIRAAMDGRMGDIRGSGQIVRFFAEVLLGKLGEQERQNDSVVESFDAITRSRSSNPITRNIMREIRFLSARMTYSRRWRYGSGMSVSIAFILFYYILGGLPHSTDYFTRNFLIPVLIAVLMVYVGIFYSALLMAMVRRGPGALWTAVLITADDAEGSRDRIAKMARLVGRSTADGLMLAATRLLSRP